MRLNFYPHHIGDYLTATAHLSWLEDCAYRRLLDVYYSREQCLPNEITQSCRLVRAISKDERKAVETVLQEFFTLTDSGWSHGRCEQEIEKAKVSAERSKANGMKGGRPLKDKPAPNPKITQQVNSGLPKTTQSEPDPKAPITNPITNPINTPKAPKGAADGFEEFWDAYPRKDAKPLAIKAFAKVTVPVGVLLAAIARQRSSEGWTKDGGKYIPMPASWLNAERWNDGVVSVVQQDDESRDRIERIGVDKGIGSWDAMAEQWAVYKDRVLKAPHLKGLTLEQLAGMASKRQGVPA